jgi:hypothetical protein
MTKAKNTPAKKDDAASVEHAPPNYTEKIKCQVLAKIGHPPRLDRVEVSRHHNGKYRVNVWQQPETEKSAAVTISPRIGLSFYLTVSDTGEVVHSDPPLTKSNSPAA